MAVSHQWFVQWSAPPAVISDITSQYNTVNDRWTNNKPEWSDPLELREQSDARRNYYPNRESNSFEQVPYRLSNNDSNHGSGIMLWLAMLGVASTQSIPADIDTPPFSTLYKWKLVDFEFPSASHRKYALSSGKYVPANVLPLGLEVWGSRLWVTIPAWRRGIPATLATLPRVGGFASPLLKPYPDWNFHRAFGNTNNCSGLTSVFRVNADTCGRLWVLDSGQVDSQDDPKQLCPPSIVVFDLHTDELIARYRIPKKYVLEDSLFANIIVDTRTPDCSDLHLYIADTWRFGLIVFREYDHKFWRFTNPLFFPDPLASNFTLHEINFQWTDGIFGLSLTPFEPLEDRTLFFHPMSSYREFYVSTAILRDPSRANDSATEFHLLGESRGLYGQSSASAVDRRGVMYYGLVSRDSIGCWDIRKPYQKQNLGVVAQNTDTLIFPNDIKVDQEQDQSVWVISNRLPLYQAGPLDYDDYNYRIMYANIEEAVRGSVCDPTLTLSHHTKMLQRG